MQKLKRNILFLLPVEQSQQYEAQLQALQLFHIRFRSVYCNLSVYTWPIFTGTGDTTLLWGNITSSSQCGIWLHSQYTVSHSDTIDRLIERFDDFTIAYFTTTALRYTFLFPIRDHTMWRQYDYVRPWMPDDRRGCRMCVPWGIDSTGRWTRLYWYAQSALCSGTKICLILSYNYLIHTQMHNIVKWTLTVTGFTHI